MSPDGSFAIGGVPPGSWDLLFVGLDRRELERQVVLAPGDEIDVGEIDLRGWIHALIVEVVDEAGAPLPALVTPVSMDGVDPIEIETGPDGRAVFATTGEPIAVRVWAEGRRVVVAEDILARRKVTLPTGIPVQFRLPRDLPQMAEHERVTLLVFEEGFWTQGFNCGPRQRTQFLSVERSGPAHASDLWTLLLPGPGRYACAFRVRDLRAGDWLFLSKTPTGAFEVGENGAAGIVETELDTASLVEALRARPR